MNSIRVFVCILLLCVAIINAKSVDHQESVALLNLASKINQGVNSTETIDSAVPLFKQCDSRWGNNRLGTGPETVCQAGCAMSSVSMIINSKGHANINPGSLNSWLISNGGFASGDLLVWTSV